MVSCSLQMVGLYRDPSGEVELSSVPHQKTFTTQQGTIFNMANTEDSAKITELRNTIASLKEQISAVSSIII